VASVLDAAVNSKLDISKLTEGATGKTPNSSISGSFAGSEHSMSFGIGDLGKAIGSPKVAKMAKPAKSVDPVPVDTKVAMKNGAIDLSVMFSAGVQQSKQEDCPDHLKDLKAALLK
jgi:hypothetical protein